MNGFRTKSELELLRELKLPEYCSYYKNLLLEEIALIPNPWNLHYGKCAVIGRVFRCNYQYIIENIRIPSMPTEYSLPEGALKVPLLTTLYPKPIQTEQTYEIFGETVFYDKDSECGNSIPVTLKELLIEIQNILSTHDDCDNKGKESALVEQLTALKEKYTPAIRLHTLNPIDEGSALIDCNLEIRMICKSLCN